MHEMTCAWSSRYKIPGEFCEAYREGTARREKAEKNFMVFISSCSPPLPLSVLFVYAPLLRPQPWLWPCVQPQHVVFVHVLHVAEPLPRVSHVPSSLLHVSLVQQPPVPVRLRHLEWRWWLPEIQSQTTFINISQLNNHTNPQYLRKIK